MTHSKLHYSSLAALLALMGPAASALAQEMPARINITRPATAAEQARNDPLLRGAQPPASAAAPRRANPFALPRPQAMETIRPIPPIPGIDAPAPMPRQDAAAELPPPPPPPLLPARPPRGPFDPVGLRAGAFTLYPSIETDAVVTDNLDQTPSGKKAAAGLRLAPALRLRSNWVRHDLDVNLKGEFIQWSRDGAREGTLSADAKLRLDIRHTDYANIETSYDIGEEDGASKRLQHDVKLKTSLTHDTGRIRLTAGANVARTFYTKPLSGGSAGGDDDYTEPSVTLRASYSGSPALRPYAEISGGLRIYDKNRSGGIKRNSKGGYAEAGVEFAPDGVWSGAIGLRLAMRDYDDPSYRTAYGAGLNGSLTWRPTRLTEVKLASTFAIDEDNTSGSSGARKYKVTITPRHMLRENLTLRGELGLEYIDYIGISDHEEILTAGAELAWRFHRGFELVGAYAAEKQWSTFASADYLENRFTIGLRYRM